MVLTKFEVSYILKCFLPNCLFDQNVYPNVLLRDDDENLAIIAVESDHLEYRKLISDFRTPLVLFAMKCNH